MKKSNITNLCSAFCLILLLTSVPAFSQQAAGQEDAIIASDNLKLTTGIIDENGEEEAVWKMKMNLKIGSSVFTATLEDNLAVKTLLEKLKEGPLVLHMNDYGGFEKVGSLGFSLPASNSQTTTYAGDIVLYQGNQIVMFYGSNSWSYTRLGRIDDLTFWEEALGRGDVTVTLSLED